jgi:hypothetical protein
MMSRRVLAVSCCVVLFAAVAPAHAGRRAATCAPATCAPATCAPATCAPKVQYVQKTILCPTTVMESRVVTVTECRPEVRQRKVMVCQQVPETKTVQRTCQIMVPETRKRTEKYMVCKPVMREETRQYTVMVPHTETRQGTRQVCKMVAVKEKRVVCEDQGHWEQRVCKMACCASAATCCPVRTYCCWVPQVVQKETEVTCRKPVMVTEPCTYTVNVCKPEQRTCKVQVCDYTQEEATREVCYTVCVPKTITRTECVTTCKTVQVEKVCNYTVMVPHQVQKTVCVPVCKMVPKTITVPVCCPQPCVAQASCE